MRRVLPVALLLALAADAGPRRVTYHRRTRGNNLALELLTNNTGQSSMATGATFYSQFSSQFTGSAAFFFDAVTATDRVGNFSWSAVGAPTTSSEKVCDNGMDCASTSTRLFSSGNVYKSANTASPASDFSCVVVSRSDTGATGDILSKNGASILFRQPPSGGTSVFINSGAFTAGSNTLARAWNVFILTYHPVGAGSSVGTAYFNSKTSTGSSSALGLVGASTNPWILGAFDTAGTTNPLTGKVLYAGCSETIWSAATIGAMYDYALGALTTSQGVSVSSSRTGALTCTNDNWATLTTQPANRPCVASNAIYYTQGATNVAPKSEDLIVANYTATNVTVTADSTASPDGTTTAETLQSTVNGGLIETTTPYVMTASTGVLSAFVKTTAGTQGVNLRLRDTTAGADICTATATATTTWQRISCTGTTTASNNHTTRIYPGGTGGTGTTVWWGVQAESFALTAYIRTEASAVIRGTQSLSVSVPALSDAGGCVAVTFNAITTQTSATARILGTGSASTSVLTVNTATTSTGNTDGTTTVTKGSLTSMVGRSTPLTATWGAGGRTIGEVGVALASGAYDGAFLGGTTLYLGSEDGSNSPLTNGLISSIKAGTTVGACQ